jgi:hypothetical protein
VRLVANPRAAEGPSSRSFTVDVDPAVLQDGLTIADLVDQQDFLLEVRDAIARANGVRTRLQESMQRAGVQPPVAPGAGESVRRMRLDHPLQVLWARLVTAPGTYQQGMIIDQLSNIVRAEGGADQKIGAEARRRLADLTAELNAIESALANH